MYLDLGMGRVRGMITSKGWFPDLCNNIFTISGESWLVRNILDQRDGNDSIVDLHACETDMSG